MEFWGLFLKKKLPGQLGFSLIGIVVFCSTLILALIFVYMFFLVINCSRFCSSPSFPPPFPPPLPYSSLLLLSPISFLLTSSPPFPSSPLPPSFPPLPSPLSLPPTVLRSLPSSALPPPTILVDGSTPLSIRRRVTCRHPPSSLTPVLTASVSSASGLAHTGEVILRTLSHAGSHAGSIKT